MAQFSYPLTHISGGKVMVVLPKSLYSTEALYASAYKYSGSCFVHLSEKGENFEVLFERKDGNTLEDTEVKNICNDFIDQKIRIDTEKQFGHIRDLIVEEAFKPVSN